MRVVTDVTQPTVQPPDHCAELELSHQMVVLHLELDETRYDEVYVSLVPHIHLRDLPIAKEIVVLHGRGRLIGVKGLVWEHSRRSRDLLANDRTIRLAARTRQTRRRDYLRVRGRDTGNSLAISSSATIIVVRGAP